MLIERIISKNIIKICQKQPRIVIIYGPRQSGKTTLIGMILDKIKEKEAVLLNGDDLRTQENFAQANLNLLKKAVGKAELLVIDEAQRITDIGLKAKLLFDGLKLPMILSGSSSFDLANKVNEPLTGRATIFLLYPFSLAEIKPELPDLSLQNRLEEFLCFGLYPKVITTESNVDKERYLYDLVNTYLYKDILSFEKVRKPKKIIDLLSLLSLQLGSEVSVAELAQNVSLSRPIVEKYLDLLEKMFVIVNIRGFSRNLRKEIYKTSKYYFFDLGLRNALIRNFNPLNLRSDTGAMFENLFLIEKMKKASNSGQPSNFYFWRTYDQKEVDFIEEKGGKLFAYETKWKEQKVKPPKAWAIAYPEAEFKVVHQNNFLEFF